MKPFHSHLGASGFVERHATGPTSCLVVQPAPRFSSEFKLFVVGATFENPGNPANTAQVLRPWAGPSREYFENLAALGSRLLENL